MCCVPLTILSRSCLPIYLPFHSLPIAMTNDGHDHNPALGIDFKPRSHRFGFPIHSHLTASTATPTPTPIPTPTLIPGPNPDPHQAIDHFYSDPAAQQAAITSQLSSSSSSTTGNSGKNVEKKLGEIWEGYKGRSVVLFNSIGEADRSRFLELVVFLDCAPDWGE